MNTNSFFFRDEDGIIHEGLGYNPIPSDFEKLALPKSKRQNTIIAALQYFRSNYDDASECFNLELLSEDEVGELLDELEQQGAS